MRRSGAAALLAAALATAAGCGAPSYSPYPLDLGESLPGDAFARCRDVLMHRYEALVRADPAAFLLQTEWAPSQDPPGQRRASVFRDPDVPGSLAVVVELRRLRIPLLGLPGWGEPRGDAAAERDLADSLREALLGPGAVTRQASPSR